MGNAMPFFLPRRGKRPKGAGFRKNDRHVTTWPVVFCVVEKEQRASKKKEQCMAQRSYTGRDG